MSFWAEMDGRARRLGILDTKLSQAASMFIALTVAKLIPRITTVSAWWFVLLAALCAIKPLYTFYADKREPVAGERR